MSATITKNTMQMYTTSPINNNVSVDIDINIINSIQHKLKNIIATSEKLESPVFLCIKDSFIQKLSYYLAGNTKRAIAIGIAGESASGKSTFTLDIIKAFNDFEKKHKLKSIISRVNIDDYYYDRSDMVKEAGSFEAFAKNYDLDVPEAFELDLFKNHLEHLLLGNDVWLPKYDMSGTAKRFDNHTLAEPSKVIITEGLFTLTDTIKDVFDISIYVDVSAKTQKERWYRRAHERNLGSAADSIYNNAMEKANVYIRPCKANADIIINGEAEREDYITITNNLMEIVELIHFNAAKI